MFLLPACLVLLSHTTPTLSQHLSTSPTVASEQVIWTGYGGNAQHTSDSNYSPLGYGFVAWSAALDSSPPINGTDLAIHYGCASLTGNTVIYPYRSSNQFEFQARLITNGQLVWTYVSTYRLPPSGWDWIPPVSGTLLPDGSYAGPQAGAGVFVRAHSDSSSQPIKSLYPYNVGSTAATYFNNVFTVTPITADASGNMYYGFRTFNTLPNGMTSGFVKISESGVASIYTCANNHWPAMNAGPALSSDGKTVYVVEGSVNGSWESHIISLNTATMTKTGDATLIDPSSGYYALAIPDGTASPLVGPDGDVYFGAYSNPWLDNDDRGWLLHFDSQLNPKGVPGGFGWDDTPSIVPSSIVPSYKGTASYLLFCKYNNYADFGLAPGNNMVAVLDPTASSADVYTGIPVMNPVIEVLGVTPDPSFDGTYPNAVHEWCINAAAVDIPGKSVVVNSEDGTVYKLDLTTGKLTSHIAVTDGIGEPYTPTIVAKDGTIFAVSKARMYAIRAKSVQLGPTLAARSNLPSKPGQTKAAPNR